MDSINSDFGDDDYVAIVSNHGWDNTAQVNMAQVDNIENCLNFTDPNKMFEFAIHGIDLSGVNSDYIHSFRHEISAIVPFDKTNACLICDGKTGHDITDCPYLQNCKKIKEVYICLCMVINKFLNLVKKINGTSQDLSRLATIDIYALQCTSEINSTTPAVPTFSTSQSFNS